jgi:Tol biopolymer transport system component
VSWHDAIWTMTPDGRNARRVVSRPGDWVSERDPAWSLGGRSIAFAANVKGEFDLWIAPAGGGAPRRLTSMPGDERWPSWTQDGRLVFSHRPAGGRWALFVQAVEAGDGDAVRLTPDATVEERHGAVSPRRCRAAGRCVHPTSADGFH